MKKLKEVFKKPVVLIVLGFIVTILTVSLLGYSFILPQFNSLGENQKKTTDLESKLSVLNKNIVAIKSINQENLAKYRSVIDSLVPESEDYLHFANLNDQLSANLGLGVSGFTISIGKNPNSPSSTAPSTASTGALPGSAVTKTQTTAQPSTPASLGYNVVASYTGNFTAIETLLRNLKNLDRAVGVSKITFSSTESDLSASITYFLPLTANDQVGVSSDSLVTLSSSDINVLTSLTGSTKFIAKPSAKPLGKNNPFQ